MNNRQIIKSKNELDRLVAEKIMGARIIPDEVNYRGCYEEYSPPLPDNTQWRDLGHYSTKIDDAWAIVEKLRLTVKPRGSYGWWASTGSLGWEQADTAPLAICLAALRSHGIEVDLTHVFFE